MRNLALALAIMGGLAACTEKAPPPPPAGEYTQTYPNVILREHTPSGGLVMAQVGALTFKGEQENRRIVMEKLSLVLQSPMGEERLRVDAGRLFTVTPFQEFDFTQKVLLTTPAGVQMEADTLTWRVGSPDITATGNLMLLSKKGILIGERYNGAIDLSGFEIFGVKGYLPLDSVGGGGDTLMKRPD